MKKHIFSLLVLVSSIGLAIYQLIVAPSILEAEPLATEGAHSNVLAAEEGRTASFGFSYWTTVGAALAWLAMAFLLHFDEFFQNFVVFSNHFQGARARARNVSSPPVERVERGAAQHTSEVFPMQTFSFDKPGIAKSPFVIQTYNIPLK